MVPSRMHAHHSVWKIVCNAMAALRIWLRSLIFFWCNFINATWKSNSKYTLEINIKHCSNRWVYDNSNNRENSSILFVFDITTGMFSDCMYLKNCKYFIQNDMMSFCNETVRSLKNWTRKNKKKSKALLN